MEENEEVLTLTANGNDGLSLALKNGLEYTAFQFDLFMPEGTDVSQILLNALRKQKHQLLYNKVADGHYRVAALSTSNRTFCGKDGELLAIMLDGIATDGIAMRNILFFDADGNSYRFDDIGLGTVVNKIETMPSERDENAIYDLQGRRIIGKPAKKGIYVVLISAERKS